MQTARKASFRVVCGTIVASAVLSAIVVLGQSAPVKAVGTVKSVAGSSVVITTDSGTEDTITFPETARIVRAEPGQADLKNAATMQVSDIQAGDRLFVRGQPGENGGVIASSAMVMKKTDITQRQQSERDQWRRGVGGIVKQVDDAAGVITIANSLAGPGKTIAVHITPQTSIRRYAPDSIKFDDAKLGTLAEIKPGDQLRARGAKNDDGSEFTAQAIVTGSFRNIAGTVVSTDAANNTVTITDLATKKPVTVKISSDSQLRKLPPFVASRLAARLKGGAPEAEAGSPGSGQSGSTGRTQAETGTNGQRQGRGSGQGGTWQGGGMRGGQRGNWNGNGGAPDFQQMLSRMPAVSLSELNKGDAVMLVATEGTSSSPPTAITLLAGVEPILTAPGSASMILSPWNLGGGEAAAGADPATQ